MRLEAAGAPFGARAARRASRVRRGVSPLARIPLPLALGPFHRFPAIFELATPLHGVATPLSSDHLNQGSEATGAPFGARAAKRASRVRLGASPPAAAPVGV